MRSEIARATAPDGACPEAPAPPRGKADSTFELSAAHVRPCPIRSVPKPMFPCDGYKK